MTAFQGCDRLLALLTKTAFPLLGVTREYPPSLAERQRAPVDCPPPVVLVAEDDPAIGSLLQELLEAEGYAAIVARQGPQILAQLETTRVDLLLLDVAVPGLDGLELCQRLRAQEHLSHERLCIILLSALATEDAAATSIAVGADDFVTKPFDIDDLVSRVELALIQNRGLRITNGLAHA